MASEVGIVNSALLKVGAQTIVSLDDGSDNANVADILYPIHRDNLLRRHTWNFATRRVKLAQSATIPVFEFDYQYPVPSDYLRVVSVSDNTDGNGRIQYKLEWDGSIEQRVILSQATELWLRYIALVTDPNRFSTDFREALSYSIAMDFAIKIVQSNTLYDRMEKAFKNAMRIARSTDGQEDWPEEFPEGSWTEVRSVGTDGGTSTGY